MSALRAWLLFVLLLAPAVVRAQEQPQPVRVGFYVNSISSVNFADGSFAIRTFAWFAHAGAPFDPATQVEIAARTADVLKVSKSKLPDESVYDWVKIRATVDQDFDFSRFPFDRQSLRFVIEAEDPINDVRLVPDIKDTRIGDLVAISDWNVVGWRLEEHPVSYDTDFGFPGQELRTYSRVVLTIDIERQRSGLIISQFLGFTMAFLISLLIYLIRPEEFGVRVGLAGGAIFAAVGNRYTLDTLLGSDSSVGLVDQLTVLVFASIYTALVVSLLVHRLKETQGIVLAERVDRTLGAIAGVIYLGLAIGAVVYARG